ncbi:MAG: hypothetical protein JW891_02230 [Candidatus Lokiarchaeota archaeon]|nr:hypothetical protein [Candidatus Lokiarchaeota archaeon]
MVITDPILFIQGALTLSFTLISLILGILLILKYLRYKEKQLLLVGITWIFLTSPWWPDSDWRRNYLFSRCALFFPC